MNAYVHDVLFLHVKFLSDESFIALPKILEAMETMGIKEEWDKLQHSEDTKKEIRIALTHRRSYIKGQVFKKYKRYVQLNRFIQYCILLYLLTLLLVCLVVT